MESLYIEEKKEKERNQSILDLVLSLNEVMNMVTYFLLRERMDGLLQKEKKSSIDSGCPSDIHRRAFS
jgi:hypothetical protein